MYVRPPLVANVSLASVAGAASVVAIAAPGAGFALRVTGWQVWLTRGSTGIVETVLTSPTYAGGFLHGRGLSVAGTPGVDYNLPEPGLQMGANEAITLATNSSAATGSTVVIIYYYVDPVT